MSQIFSSSSTKIICIIAVMMLMCGDFSSSSSSPRVSAQQETVDISLCQDNNCFGCVSQSGPQNECFGLPGGNTYAIATCSYQNSTCFHGVFSELSNLCSTVSSNSFTNYSLACNSCFSPDGAAFFQVTCDAQTGDVYFANYTQPFGQTGCQGTLGVPQLMPTGVCTPIGSTIYHFQKMSSGKGFSAQVATLSEYQDSGCSQYASVATMPISICSDLGQIQCGPQITTVSPPPPPPSTTTTASPSTSTSIPVSSTTTTATTTTTTATTTTSTSGHQTTDSNATTTVSTTQSPITSSTSIIISTSTLPPTTTSTTAVASSTSATALSSSTSTTTSTASSTTSLATTTASTTTASGSTTTTAAPTSPTVSTTSTTSASSTTTTTTTTTTTGPTPSPAPSIDHKCPAAPGVRFVNNTYGPVYFDPSRITLSTISNMLSPTSSSVFQFSTCSASPFPSSVTTGCNSATAYITQTDVSGTICLLQATLLVNDWAASATQTYPNQVFTATYRSLESKVDVALSVTCNPASDSNDLVALHSRYQVSPSSMGSGWQIYSLQLQSRVACLANNIPVSSTPAPPSTPSPTSPSSTQSPNNNNNNNNNNNSSNSSPSDNNTEKLAIVIGAGAAGLAIMIGIFCFIKNRGKKPNHSHHFDPSFPDDKSLYPTTTASGRKQNNQHERTKVNASGMSAASTDHNDMEAPLNDDSEEN